MGAEMAAVQPHNLSVCEIGRRELPALRDFFADVLGRNTPLEIITKTVEVTYTGRLLCVADGAGWLMVMPFDLACDGAATVGRPVFHPRAADRKPLTVAAAALEIGRLGSRTLHIALPCASELGDIFLCAGFVAGPKMTEMSGPVPSSCDASEGNWVLYAPERRPAFAQVFYLTLENSLDFPELPVCRDASRLMRAFEERGVFVREDFALLKIGAQSVGIILVTMVGQALEIAYMGLVPQHRGTGLSKTLMARVVERARAHNAADLHLTVDERNKPALALYGKFGLSEKRAVRVYYRVTKKN